MIGSRPTITMKDFCRRAKEWLASEKGATLTEMLIALPITITVIGFVGTAIYQFFITTAWGVSRLDLMHDLQNASYWLNLDAFQSKSFSEGSGLEYGTFTRGDSYIQYRYSYDAYESALVREELLGGVSNTRLVIARNIIHFSDISFSQNDRLITVTITASSPSGGIEETTTLKLTMRVPTPAP